MLFCRDLIEYDLRSTFYQMNAAFLSHHLPKVIGHFDLKKKKEAPFLWILRPKSYFHFLFDFAGVPSLDLWIQGQWNAINNKSCIIALIVLL